jgi:Na+-driven multidrug efflux pump
MGVISMWGISVPLAWYLGIYMDYGLIGIYIAFIVDEWLRGLIMFWRWRSRVWEQMSFV